MSVKAVSVIAIVASSQLVWAKEFAVCDIYTIANNKTEYTQRVEQEMSDAKPCQGFLSELVLINNTPFRLGYSAMPACDPSNAPYIWDIRVSDASTGDIRGAAVSKSPNKNTTAPRPLGLTVVTNSNSARYDMTINCKILTR